MGWQLQRSTVGAMVVLGVAVCLLRFASKGQLTYSTNDFAVPPLARVTKPALATLTLGMPRLYTHATHTWMLQVFGDPDLHEKNPELIKEQVLQALRFAPDDENLYLVPCFALMFEFARPGDCRDILALGMQAVPASWIIPAVLGYVESFRFKNFDKGRAYFAAASQIPGAPPYLARLAQRTEPFINPDDADLNALRATLEEGGASKARVPGVEEDISVPPPPPPPPPPVPVEGGQP